MEEKVYPMTLEGKAKLEAELEDLKVNKRKEIIERIKIARSYGDLSENSEYDAAKDEQAHLDREIKELTKLLNESEVIDLSLVKENIVSIGKTVKVKFLDTKKEETYYIVSNTTVDIFKNKKVRATILGVSNVGKSSIINLLLKDDRITTSKYSGTTLKSINNKVPDTQITIVDTPGLIPVGRVSDLISIESGLKLVPSGEISRKTFKLEENQVFMFDVFCRFEILKNDSENKAIFSAYSSKNVKFHVTRRERVADLLEGDFFQLLSQNEKDKYFENEFATEIMKVGENEELVIAGLGWINVKRGALKVKLTYPKAVKVVVREAIFKAKKN